MFLLYPVKFWDWKNDIDYVLFGYKHVRLFFLFILLFFYFSFRVINIGTDAFEYKLLYDYISINNGMLPSYLANKELGFSFFNLIANYLGFDYLSFSSFYLSLSAIIVFFQFKNNPKLMLFLLYFLISSGYFMWISNGMRQAMAISIVMIAIGCINKESFSKYFIFIFIASLFHVSALIMLPFYFVKHFSCRYLFVFLIFSTLLKLLGVNLINADFINQMIIFIPGFNEYYHYLDSAKLSLNSDVGFQVVYMLKTLFFIFVFYISSFKDDESKSVIYLKFGSLSFIAYNLVGDVELVNRVLQYFNLSILISFSYFILNCGCNNKRYLISFSLLVFYFLVFSVENFKFFNAVYTYR